MHGVLTALVTPLRNGEVDEASFRRLLVDQIAAGLEGVVVCGSTGEAATMTREERRRLVNWTVETCRGTGTRAWVGTGTNDTRTSIELTREAEEQGADGAMIVAPYYNKPTPEGLFQHFERVASECGMPLIAYNVPGRTGVNMSPEVVARIHGLGRYVAVKEASGSLEQVSDIRSLCAIPILSGDDSLTLPMLALGATGVISVVSNLLPAETKRMVESFRKGDIEAARAMHFQLLPFFRAAFWETNPSPIKMLLHIEGRMSPETRLPLVPAHALRERLQSLLDTARRRGVHAS